MLANAVLEGPAAVDNGKPDHDLQRASRRGKTFNAINLAISMAMELDYTVLLVDATYRVRRSLRELDLPPSRD